MKRLFILVFCFVISGIVFISCTQKPDLQPVGKLKTYTDKAMGFTLQYPENWFGKPTAMGFAVFTKKADIQRFYQYETKGAPGAKIDFSYMKIDSVPIEKIFDKYKKFTPEYYSKPESVTIDGVKGWKINYEFELEDGLFKGEAYWAAKDAGTVSVIIFEAFSSGFATYKPTFDEIIKTVKLATTPELRKDTITQIVEADPPSQTLKFVTGDGYGISIPENFEREKGAYIGQRRGDCYIRVDVIDASKQSNVEKIANDSKPNFPGAGETKSINLAGVKGMRLSYQPSKQVKGEITFVVKDKKLFRITINWFTGEEASYKPVFQKCVETFKFQ
jgi:hypothetical protein